MNNSSDSLKAFRYFQYADLHVGAGLFGKLPLFLKDRGYQRPAFLADEGFLKTDLFQQTIERGRVEFPGGLSVKASRGNLEPTYDYLAELTEVFRSLDFDVLVAVGGGSCMDTGKALAALKTNPGHPLEYRGFDKLQRPGVPAVCIPTTAGTGSEVSFNASFVDTSSKRKMGINGNYMFAKHAILDPETTITCPYRAALGAGVDALVHAMEGFVCKQRTPVTQMLAKEAISLIVQALPSLKTEPGNLGQRQHLLLGAAYGGLIQMNSGSGVAAAISYPLSVYYQVPHGIGGGMFLLKVVRFNIDHGFYDYADLAPLIGVETPGRSMEQRARAVLEHLEKLWAFLEVPTKLQAFGIGRDKMPHVLETMKTQQPGFAQNPLPFTVTTDLLSLLESFF